MRSDINKLDGWSQKARNTSLPKLKKLKSRNIRKMAANL